MKNSIPKEAIPDTKVFVNKQLETSYFDPTFHFHQEYQLFLVLQGKGTRFVGKGIIEWILFIYTVPFVSRNISSPCRVMCI